jgi:phosphoglucomutase
MSIHPLAGQKAPKDFLIDPLKLESDYYSKIPNTADPGQLVAFGTSGHRGSPFDATFTEAHILAITQAICDYRQANGISGPLFMGKDTHGISGPAQRTALEVLAANGVETNIQAGDGFTPTPVVSHAILTYNETHPAAQSDGIVITPSHNPPRDGGFKYNPPDGGPADTAVTNWMQDRANALMKNSNKEVRRVPYESALKASTTHQYDFVTPYVIDLANVIDLDAIRAAGIRIGIDPLGGAALHYWQPLAERFRLNITVVNQAVDPTFSFMTLDHDGKIRMDCSSPYAMAGLVKLKDDFDISFGNDPDSDRHGIVTRSAGLLNPNHYLAVAIRYLLGNRAEWPKSAAVGKTLVSSAIIDRVVADLHRTLWEVPVGFKWFVPGLLTGECCFGGEESAGASFLRRNGKVWTTDKDGPILGLLAAEITARTGKDPGEHYREITSRFGESFYTRIDTPATPEIKEKLKKLTPAAVTVGKLAGEPITAKLTKAPGNDAPIGGLKVASAKGWFAARPSGTENIYKLYAESLVSKEHLDSIVTEAGKIIAAA